MGEEERWARVRQIMREEIDAAMGRMLAALEEKKQKTSIKLVNGRWEGITPDVLASLKSTYEAVDVERQLKEAATWCVLNPGDAPRKNFGAFIGTWMKRHQDRHSIRALPSRLDNPPNLCAYCLKPCSAAVNGYRTCNEHFQLAMDGVRPGKMPGVEAKAVAGAD